MREISAKDNPVIKHYTRLSAQKKYRRETGLFVAEGVRICTDAVNEGAVETLLITHSAYEKNSELAHKAENMGAEAILITDELGERLSETTGTQGVFSICRVLDKFQLTDTIYGEGKFLVLYNLQDPGNMGTIIRTADAMGITAVFAVCCCDLYSPKTVRSTMGSLFRVPIMVEEDIFSLLESLSAKGVKSFAAVIDRDAVSLTDCDFSGGSAVLIGNEGSGLPAEVADACGRKMTIKMQGNANSLNAAIAAGIIIWQMMR